MVVAWFYYVVVLRLAGWSLRIDAKTIYSGRLMSIDKAMLEALNEWRRITQFPTNEDWMFASPVKLGRLPVSYTWVWLVFQQASTRAGVGNGWPGVDDQEVVPGAERRMGGWQ
jgi:hypothetical protein